MMKNSKKGFTLIELLVVIAIIGILSAVVLASLNTARTKGRAASAMGSMNSMRAQAELYITASGTYPTNICSTTAGDPLAALMAAVKAQAGTTDVVCNTPSGTDFSAWAASIDTSVLHFCVDSSGFAGVDKTATLGVCK